MKTQDTNIYFRIKYKKECRTTGASVILLEPLYENNIDSYMYDIGLLKKDFFVEEIHDNLHFVYESEIKDFFIKHEEEKVNKIPSRLLILNNAAEEVELTI